ncbi:hypothetical protein EBZ37_11965, partial [bacterium]|nr:hypothetical protein [bacterium]
MSKLSLEDIQDYLSDLQKRCLPGVWSKGVQLTRNAQIQLEKASNDEILVRVPQSDRPVSAKVQLWPDDEDALCDCGDRNEICSHIAAAVIFIRAGGLEQTAPRFISNTGPKIEYRLEVKDNAVLFERYITQGEKQLQLGESLVSYMGGITSGRIQGISISPSQTDYAIDSLLSGPEFPTKRGLFPAHCWKLLCPHLAEVGNLTLNGEPIQVERKPKGFKLKLEEVTQRGKKAYQFSSELVASSDQSFNNGLKLIHTQPIKTLYSFETPSPQALALVESRKVFQTRDEKIELFSELLPQLRKKVDLVVLPDEIPEVRTGTHRIQLRLDQESPDTLCVVPSIIMNEEADEHTLWKPDPIAEHALTRQLQSEYHLTPHQPFRMNGSKAVDWLARIKSKEVHLSGSGLESFSSKAPLQPSIEFESLDSAKLFFKTSSGGAAS